MRDKVIMARQDDNTKLEILRSFEPLIKKSIKMYVKDKEYYEDAMQQGYLTVLACIRNYDLNKCYPFEAYVKRSVIYTIRDFAKKIKNDLSLDAETTDDGGSLYDILESGVNVEDESMLKDDTARLKRALSSLSDKQREVIEDVYFKNMSMVDICKRRRCHYMAIAGLKDRAIKKLREEMEK